MNKESYINKPEPIKTDHVISTENVETITRYETNEYLYENLPVSLASSLMLATILLFQLSGFVNQTALYLWYGAVLIIIVIRIGLLVWFRKTKAIMELQNFHYKLFTISSSVSALLWGILASFLMPENIFYQTFILIFVAGIIGGAIVSLGAKYLASMLFVFFALFPIIVWMGLKVLDGNQIYNGIFFAMALYFLFTTIIAYKSSSLVTKSINLKNSNLELLKLLTKHVNQIELFSQLGETLEKSRSDLEVGKACKQYLADIFPEFSGAIFILAERNTRLKALEVWNDFTAVTNLLDFSRDECLASKTKSFYISHDNERCMHCLEASAFYVCIPIQTTIEFFGILKFILKPDMSFQHEEYILSQKPLFTRIATNIAFAFSTIQYQHQLQEEATQDTLTGLFNRRYLDNYCNMEFARFKRTATSISFIMIDIDHFKIFNDQYGHEMGDTVLHEVAQFLKRSVRGSDFACRYGGEEFMLILPGSTLEVASQRAERIREGVKHISILYKENPIPNITISIGVAIFPEQGDTQAAIIKAADDALYQAKETGRDKVCIAT